MLPKKIKIVEVGPRDGLQNEPQAVSVEDRIKFINRLSECGLTAIEVGSFVSPKWVPQMAGSRQVLQSIDHKPGINYCVLTPNERGYRDAIESGAKEIAVFAAASETFSRTNINCSIDESLQRFRPICEDAKASRLRVRGYISCVLDCPYEGAIEAERVAEIAAELIDAGCDEISLGDTIGTGTPGRVQLLIDTVGKQVGIDKLAIHCHDTYGQALANILAAVQKGVAIVDSSVAGLGGCPYAKGASGNVATEDVVYMLDGMGIETGVSMKKLLDASEFICHVIGKEPVSKAGAALLRKRGND
jgi:hydroxymethylglutaryl-CoA lyase